VDIVTPKGKTLKMTWGTLILIRILCYYLFIFVLSPVGKSHQQTLLLTMKPTSSVLGLMHKETDDCPKALAPFAWNALCVPDPSLWTPASDDTAVGIANFFIKKSGSDEKVNMGDHFYVTVDGVEYLVRMEYHCHPKKEKPAPQGVHMGATVRKLK
jgi:hypothetical protein